jgi:hypothetical protein
MVTLWFSHLKGPDIKLCQSPEVKLKDWSEEILSQWVLKDYVPFLLALEPINLVFINSGSRAGVISSVKATFEPNEVFKPFYRDVFVRVTVGETYGGLPKSVEEGDAFVVNLSVDIEVINWKREFRLEEIQDISNLRDAFTKSVELDKDDFAKFVNLFRSKAPLGILRVSMIYSTRRSLKTKEIAKVKVENSCELAIKGLEKMLESWDTASAVNDLLTRLSDFPYEIIRRLDQNLQIIRSGVRGGVVDINDSVKKLQDKKSIERLVFAKEKLIDEIDGLHERIKAYNHACQLLMRAGENPNKEQVDSMNENERLTIEKMNFTLIKLQKLRDQLIRQATSHEQRK